MNIILFIVFACILHHFYLVDDICDTTPTFSYQYFIIYNVQYDAPYARISPLSPPISDIKTPIRYDPNILEPCIYMQFENKCHTDPYQNTYQMLNKFRLNNLASSKIYV